MAFHELNAAEITNDFRVNYDPAGDVREVTYRLDGGIEDIAPITTRSFTKDTLTEGAQSSNKAYKNSGWDRGHLAQREAFKGTEESERAADHFLNVVPMAPWFNEHGSWRKAEVDTLREAEEYGSVLVNIQVIYGENPQRLRDGTPIPLAFVRRVARPDGQILSNKLYMNR